MLTRSWSAALPIALALSLVAGCKGKPTQRRALDQPAPAAPATPTAPPTTTITPPTTTPTATPTAGGAMPASVEGCVPVEPSQHAGKATLTVVGDGQDVHDLVVPAVCGALHTEATRRFAVGDGTLFKACLPGGVAFSITADVALTGPQSVTFVYDDYKKKTALLELAVAGKGTYNQRDEPTDADSLTIAYDWHTALAHVDVVWPSKKDRVVRVDAAFDCGGPIH